MIRVMINGTLYETEGACEIVHDPATGRVHILPTGGGPESPAPASPARPLRLPGPAPGTAHAVRTNPLPLPAPERKPLRPPKRTGALELRELIIEQLQNNGAMTSRAIARAVFTGIVTDKQRKDLSNGLTRLRADGFINANRRRGGAHYLYSYIEVRAGG
jgi:hypothetical protein